MSIPDNQAKSLDIRVNQAKQSKDEAERLIEEYVPYMQSQTARFSSRFSRDHYNDIYSVALMSFYEAINNYDIDKGHFFPFLNRVMHDRVIDFMRRIGGDNLQTIPLEEEDGDNRPSAQSAALTDASIRVYDAQNRQAMLADEIEQFKTELSAWGITFSALVARSPKHKKLRETYRKVVARVCDDPEIMGTIKEKRYFPIKAISILTGVPQKTLERARTFILSSLIIKTGDYEYISDYVDDRRTGI